VKITERYASAYIEHLGSLFRDIDHRAIEAVSRKLVETALNGNRIFVIGLGDAEQDVSSLSRRLGKALHRATRRECGALSDVAWPDSHGDEVGLEICTGGAERIEAMVNGELSSGDVVILAGGVRGAPCVNDSACRLKIRGAVTVAIACFREPVDGGQTDFALLGSAKNEAIASDFVLLAGSLVADQVSRLLDPGTQRVLFLDRDGVINERAKKGEYVTSWEQFHFRDGIVDLLVTAVSLGYRNVVITNQQCVGKGIISRRELDSLHRRMAAELARFGANIDGVHYCPHLAEMACSCRKPRAGLLYRAMNEMRETIDLPRSYFIGDQETDVAAGRAFGVRTILLSDGNATVHRTCADHVVSETRDIARILRD
jgi:histidinol-phosphate phosphatase family protein